MTRFKTALHYDYRDTFDGCAERAVRFDELMMVDHAQSAFGVIAGQTGFDVFNMAIKVYMFKDYICEYIRIYNFSYFGAFETRDI